MTILREQFLEFCSQQYNCHPSKLSDVQRLQVEDAFYAGSVVVYNLLMTGGAMPIEIHQELIAFNDKIMERYEKAGLVKKGDGGD